MLTETRIVRALNLPPRAVFQRKWSRITAAELQLFPSPFKRLIRKDFEGYWDLGVFGSPDIDVPEFHSDTRRYRGLFIISIRLRPWANPARAIRAVLSDAKFPFWLIIRQGEDVSVAGAHGRYEDGDKSKYRFDGPIEIATLGDTAHDAAFLESLDISNFPRSNFWHFHDGWITRIRALNAAHKNPGFSWDLLQRPDSGDNPPVGTRRSRLVGASGNQLCVATH